MNHKGYKHLTYNDRLIIDRMLRNGFNKKEIALAIGCSLRTIYYELSRSTYVHTNDDLTEEVRYNPEGAETRYRQSLKEKGLPPKIKSDPKLCEYIEYMICEQRYSPAAVVAVLKPIASSFTVTVKSHVTIYNAIRRGDFDNITLKKLPRRGKHGTGKKSIKVQKRASAGTSIEKRPEEIKTRETFGHWEMDCVIGKQGNKKTLLVLTERKTRYEHLEVLKSHTVEEVVKALNRVERKCGSDFYKIFKSITCDNGTEFSDPERIEESKYRKGDRFDLYYCHPRAPSERGSNENCNLLIRRWYPKGSDFDKTVTNANVKDVSFWINTYPRSIFDGESAYDRYVQEIENLGCGERALLE